MNRAFLRGARSVIVTGTDCPGVTADVLIRAFGATENHDVVFCPATDGGYVLVGLRRPAHTLFKRDRLGYRQRAL